MYLQNHETMKQKKNLVFITFAVSILAFAFNGCSDSDDVQTSTIEYDCYIDSVGTVAVEDILNVSLSNNAIVAISDNNIVDARLDKWHTKKHCLDLKRMGRVHVMVNDAGKVYTLSLTVKSALIDYRPYLWHVDYAEEKFICSQEVRQEIIDDFHSNSIVPIMGNGWKLMASNELDKCWVHSEGDDEATLMVNYDRETSEYVFTSRDNNTAEQRFKFVVTSHNEYGTRNGELKCDMTEYYRNRYGKDKVEFVGIIYTVSEEHV